MMTKKRSSTSNPPGIKLNLQGRQPGDELPTVTLYQLDRHGRAVKKIAVAEDDLLKVPRDLAKEVELIALGPDVDNLEQLDKDNLQIFRAEEIVPHWLEAGEINLPRPIWLPWWMIFVCVTGKIKKCWLWLPPLLQFDRFRFDRLQIGRGGLQGLDLTPVYFSPIKCAPLCNGIVEIYERTCCCDWWDIIPHIPELIPELLRVPFPEPDPGPLIPRIEPRLEKLPPETPKLVKRRLKFFEAQVEPARRVALDKRVSRDLHALQDMNDPQQMFEYVVDRPYLRPVFCHCSSRKVGETIVNIDGSFTFCYWRWLMLFNCTVSYTYKVKQFIGGVWVTVYDGEAANAYFSADEIANLVTFHPQAETCTPPDPPPVDDHGRPFILLQAIGVTDSHALHSPLQSSLDGVTDPGNSGLLDMPYSPDCPLAGTLKLLLWIDPALEALGARYYRFSLAETEDDGTLKAGQPQALTDSVSWRRWANGVWPPQPENVALGPENPLLVNNEPGLMQIPYYSATNRWLGNQFHYNLDTTAFTNGRYALILEVFDAAGNRLRPNGATGAGTDTNFHFLHWDTEPTTSVVDYAQLLHLLEFNNTRCYADIVDLRKDGVKDEGECQFKTGTKTSTFSVGYRAYHVDGYMLNYVLDYQRGLNGIGLNGTGELASGTANAGMGGDPQESATRTFDYMLGEGLYSKCTFSLELRVYGRHTNGDSRLLTYDDKDDASFALEIESMP